MACNTNGAIDDLAWQVRKDFIKKIIIKPQDEQKFVRKEWEGHLEQKTVRAWSYEEAFPSPSRKVKSWKEEYPCETLGGEGEPTRPSLFILRQSQGTMFILQGCSCNQTQGKFQFPKMCHFWWLGWRKEQAGSKLFGTVMFACQYILIFLYQNGSRRKNCYFRPKTWFLVLPSPVIFVMCCPFQKKHPGM